MATISPTKAQLGAARLYTWETLTDTDADGAPIEFGDIAKSAVGQFVGNFGGGAVEWQGSNDGVNYFTMLNLAGSSTSITADGGAQFTTLPRFIRPFVASGASVDVDAKLLVREI